MTKIRILIVALVLALVAMVQIAEAKTHHSVYIEELSNKAVSLSSADLLPEERNRQFRELLKKSFDIPRIARYSVGYYWRKFTPEQKKEFVRLFEDVIVSKYSDLFSNYAGFEFMVIKEQTSGSYAIVTSEIRSGSEEPIILIWQILINDGQQKVVDISVEGVSMVITYRKEYTSVLSKNNMNVEALFWLMRKMIARQKRR